MRREEESEGVWLYVARIRTPRVFEGLVRAAIGKTLVVNSYLTTKPGELVGPGFPPALNVTLKGHPCLRFNVNSAIGPRSSVSGVLLHDSLLLGQVKSTLFDVKGVPALVSLLSGLPVSHLFRSKVVVSGGLPCKHVDPRRSICAHTRQITDYRTYLTVCFWAEKDCHSHR